MLSWSRHNNSFQQEMLNLFPAQTEEKGFSQTFRLCNNPILACRPISRLPGLDVARTHIKSSVLGMFCMNWLLNAKFCAFLTNMICNEMSNIKGNARFSQSFWSTKLCTMLHAIAAHPACCPVLVSAMPTTKCPIICESCLKRHLASSTQVSSVPHCWPQNETDDGNFL